jgi:hypothetical protein
VYGRPLAIARGVGDNRPPMRRLLAVAATADLPSIPATKLRIIWNPLGGGHPETRENAFFRFYPGDLSEDRRRRPLRAYGQYTGPQNEVLYAFARDITPLGRPAP